MPALRIPTRSLRLRARELFACALETPGGLKVQTIHALCTRLLQQFPFEANVPARFAVLDERDQTEMMERANLAVLLDASRDPDSADRPRAQHRDGQRRRRHLQGRGARGLPEPRSFHGMDRLLPAAPNAAAAQVSAALGVDADDRIEDVERAIVDGPHLPRSRWTDTAALLDTGSKTDQDQAARLREALASSGAAQVDEYLDVFLTERANSRKSLVTKKFGDNTSGAGASVRAGKRCASAR